MNSYDLSRNWFDFCFDNPEKINPNHTAIYFFAIEHCNRLGWKEKFGFPTQMAIDAIGIKKHQTYINYFNDLVDWGFFKLIQKSKNQYSSNIISLINAIPKNGKALDKAIIKHAAKQTESMRQSNSPINKQINKETNKQETIVNQKDSNDLLIFENFRKSYPGTKKGTETEFLNFKKKHKDWKEVLPELLPLLKCQINERTVLKSAGQFVPEWKHLSTWINQRCWEEEFTTEIKPELTKSGWGIQ
jgi:hypothetical protein